MSGARQKIDMLPIATRLSRKTTKLSQSNGTLSRTGTCPKIM
jgi:hypothetical protein